MVHQLIILAMRVLELMFFTGLLGCSLVVVISWVSILKDGFSDKDEPSLELHENNAPKQK
jgi:hypothetical protein